MRLIEVGSTGGPLRTLAVSPGGGRRVLERAALERALDLLLACGASRLRVELAGTRLWSLRRLWLGPLRRAQGEAQRARKELDFSVRCPRRVSDVLLKPLAGLGAQVMIEGDGEPQSLRRAAEALRRLRRAGVEGVFELHIGPEHLDDLAERLERLVSLAPAPLRGGAGRPPEGFGRPVKVRLRPRAGKPWPKGAEARLLKTLGSWLDELNRKVGDKPQPLDVLNIYEDGSPGLLAGDLSLAADGTLAWRTAREAEGVWPEFLRARAPVAVRGVADLGPLFPGPADLQSRAAAALSGASRALWLNNVHLELRLGSFFRRPIRGFRDRSENAAIKRGLLTADFKGQDRFLRLRLPGLDRLFYFLRSGCQNDCIFCKRKVDDPGQPVSEVEAALKQNRKVGRRKVALLGNEPLLHPHITEIVRLCRRCGFEEVEVMTSGALLADRALARSLKAAGATSFPIPLYSSDPAEHDALVRKEGSFREVMAGVENLKRLGGVKVFLHTNLMKQNLAALPGLERLARELGLPFSILPLRPKDPDSMNLPYRDLAPSYSQIAREVKVSSLAAFPVCVQRRVQDPPVIPSSRIADSIKLYVLHQNFVKLETCSGCPDYGRCVGTFRAQLEACPKDLELLKP